MKILKTRDEIHKRVFEIGHKLTNQLKGREPVFICILNGSFVFFSDLIRAVNLDIECEFLGVSSYKNKKVSSGEVQLTLDLDAPIEGKDIVIVEDIVDSGLTMNYLVNLLQARKPRSLTTVTLLYKPDALIVKTQIDYIGFEIGDEFVVGYGIDYAGQHRGLPDLHLLG